MNDDQKKTQPEPPISPETAVMRAVFDERIRIIDAVFAAAAENGWCNAVITALKTTFPEEIADTVTWSDGYFRTSDGYDVEGRDWEGYDRAGLDYDGYNREGVNSEGRTMQEEAEWVRTHRRWCDQCEQYHQ